MVFGQLAVGGTLLLLLPSLETVGIGFFRTNGLVFLTTVLLGIFLFPISFWWPIDFSGHSVEQFGWGGLLSILFFLFALVLFIYNLRLWFRHPHHSRPLLWTATGVGLLAVLSSVGYYLPSSAGSIRMISLGLYSLISSLLLGAGVLAMLLGHSYLTRPSLSIVPLRHLARIFMWLVFVEGGMALLSLLLSSEPERLWNALRLNSFEGLYLWIRLLIGIGGPMVVAPMVLQTVKERATMSATGLLYIAMMMVIVGEIFSRFFLLVDVAFL